jgi:flagellar basal-body rod protein FlgC
MDLINSLHIAASGMKAQSDRLRIVSQNIANADSTGEYPGDQPYRRKTITFKNEMDRNLGIEKVEVSKYGTDKTPFPTRYDPNHPAADRNGYVQEPNINPMIEMMDMREARRSYEANLNIIEVSKSMLKQTIGLINQ